MKIRLIACSFWSWMLCFLTIIALKVRLTHSIALNRPAHIFVCTIVHLCSIFTTSAALSGVHASPLLSRSIHILIQNISARTHATRYSRDAGAQDFSQRYTHSTPDFGLGSEQPHRYRVRSGVWKLGSCKPASAVTHATSLNPEAQFEDRLTPSAQALDHMHMDSSTCSQDRSGSG